MRKHEIIILFVIVIFIFGSGIRSANATTTVDITPTDDAYVVANYDDPSDVNGLEHANTGHLPFLKMWYAWDVTKTGRERIASIVYLKFNLTGINYPIESASLVLHPFSVNLTAPLRPADMYTGFNSNWNESSLVFIGAPAFATDKNSTAFISNSEANESVSWDATRQVRDHEGSLLTLVLVLREMHIHNEELVDFYSKDSSNATLKPSLVLVPESHGMQADNSNPVTGTIYDSAYVYVAAILACVAILAVVWKRRGRKLESKTEEQP